MEELPLFVTFLFVQDDKNPGEYIMNIICDDGYILDFSFKLIEHGIPTQLKVGKHLARAHNVLEIIIPAEFQDMWNNVTPIDLPH